MDVSQCKNNFNMIVITQLCVVYTYYSTPQKDKTTQSLQLL